MKIHEFQAKQVLKRFGVPVPRNQLALTPDEAQAAARTLGTPVVVVKAQVHAGGRGKAGGVKVVKDAAGQTRDVAATILGMTLVSPQTGPKGVLVKKVIVEEGLAIEREFYCAVVLDRAKACPVVMASREGGVEIEEVAAKHPEKILKEWVDPALGLLPFQGRRMAYKLGIPKASVNKFAALAGALAKCFMETDASLVEVNPLVLLKDGGLTALDAKMTFDENALFRHKDIQEFRDLDEENPAETEAKKYDLSYIALDGDIGCMVNGAGLAMATLDVIKLHGGEPANFLDVGGGATKEKVMAAFKIILTDPKVRAILVNIFGGIMRCDVIAEGVIAAAKEISLKQPLVVRLEGTNVDAGRKLLRESGLQLEEASDLTDAAKKVVAARNRAS
jgi:succinyl-CoA synthetase beta subunit